MPNQHVRNPLSVRLPEAEEMRLRAYAEANHMTLGEAVRLAVRELIGDEVSESRQAPDTSGNRPNGEHYGHRS